MSGDADDDEQLVQRCRRGDATAWTALVERYQRLVYAVARRAGLDEHGAADVFQTVFQRLVEHLPRIREADRLQAWIVTTAKRETLAQLRGQKRTTSLTPANEDEESEFDVPDDSPIAEAALEELQQLHLLRLGLDRLDARCRDLLLLVFRDDDDALPYDEVARRMNMPVGSIGPTRSRCLGKLRSLLA